MEEAFGVIIFMILVLIGTGLVSVHYRKKYEELRKEVGLINTEERKKEIREARKELRKIYEKYTKELFKIINKVDNTLLGLENS